MKKMEEESNRLNISINKEVLYLLTIALYSILVANPPDDEDTTPSKDEDSQNSPGAGGAVLVRKTKDSNQRSPTNGEGEEELPPVDTIEACDKAAERLRELSNHLNHGEIPMDVLQQTVGYAVSVLEAIYMDETKRLLDEDDELSEVQPDAVPPEVREWLASTFTRQMSTTRRRSEDKLRFRSVAHAIRAGIMVDSETGTRTAITVMKIKIITT
ncbi:hypothetical protein TNCT_136981 [Trichonephila clavata]|uniref:PDE1 N-terminal domain-containing protein n=1 Tax=Trichonephila clavata TaxID=2740835 RepID=A0A8X6K6N1_TRICU|nr:hypothetical protein TNCT_136981 [Trichonephila clavata]